MSSFWGIYIASRDKTGGAVEYNADESVGCTVLFTPFLKANIAQCPINWMC